MKAVMATERCMCKTENGCGLVAEIERLQAALNNSYALIRATIQPGFDGVPAFNIEQACNVLEGVGATRFLGQYTLEDVAG